jgi:hypothetical protein
MSRSSISIDLATQYAKQFGLALYFIDNDELPRVLLKIEFRIIEFLTVAGEFKIDIDGVGVSGNLQGKCCFTYLTWTENGYCRVSSQGFLYAGLSAVVISYTAAQNSKI